MQSTFFALLLIAIAGTVAWRLPSVRREMGFAALLSTPLLILTLIAGNGIYLEFWQQLVVVAALGALADGFYFRTLRRFLTPVLHPHRLRLKWLIAGPFVALILFWVGHLSLLLASILTLALGLIAIVVIGGSLVWDALASAIGFGGLYVILYLALRLPITGPSLQLNLLSGISLFGRPVATILLAFFFGSLWGPLCAAFRQLPNPGHPSNFHPRHHFVKQIIVLIFIIVAAIGAYWTYDRFVRLPKVLAASPAEGSRLTDLIEPISISFDRPVDRRALSLTITPPVTGDISFADPYLQRTFVRQVIFTPREHLMPGTTYTVQVTHLTNVLGRSESDYHLSFQTPDLPQVAATSLKSGQSDVPICDPFTVTLDQPVNHFAEFSFTLNPAVDLVSSLASDGKTYTLTPNQCLSQSTQYSLAVQRRLTVYGAGNTLLNPNDEPITLQTVDFTTKGAPGIAGFTPQGGGVSASTKQFTLTFTEAMSNADLNSHLVISPTLEGKWQWTNDHVAVFTAANTLPLNTSFTVTVSKGLKDAHNGFLTDDAAFTFATIGHVQVSSLSPRNGSGGVTVDTPIRVTFDQPVDHASAEQHFSILPVVTGSFSWQGQTLLYSANLSKDSSYQVVESAGVISQIGLNSDTAAHTSFQTEESITQLAIPVYYQQKALSCEAASLKMALNYRGIGVGESTLLANLGADTTPRQNNIWGDPDQTFVGDVNGQQDSTGYGVHAAPIASVANQYRSAEALYGISPASVARQLAQGNPVVFWGTAGGGQADSWNTVGGRQINTWIGEHVRLAIGFTGPVEHPSAYIINDPIFGRLRWTPSQFQSQLNAFGGMGVAIY